MAFSYKKTFVLGLGFFVITMTWALYNAFVPIFLNRFIASTFLVGLIMTIDNVAAITLQPLFGAKSDVTRTRFGRRMPFLLVGIPLSAVGFAFIPLGYTAGFVNLMAAIILFNTAMSIYRAPTVALMPDLTPSVWRSKANGVINLMGGVGGVLAFFVGASLYDIAVWLPFVGSAGLMLLVSLVLYVFIKEPAVPEPSADEEPSMGIVAAFWYTVKESDRSALFILLAVLFWFTGYGAVETFFTLYGVNFLGIGESAAAFSLGFFSLAFLLAAIPAGFLAGRIGRRRSILFGLGLMLVIFALLFFARSLLWVQVLLIGGGICWALININSYPMVVEMAGEQNIGVYTGLYYFYSSMAAIVGPTLFGLLRDIFGFQIMFVYAWIFFFAAFICMLRVRRGEALVPRGGDLL